MWDVGILGLKQLFLEHSTLPERELALEHKTNRNRKKSSRFLVFLTKNNAIMLGIIFVVLLSLIVLLKDKGLGSSPGFYM